MADGCKRNETKNKQSDAEADLLMSIEGCFLPAAYRLYHEDILNFEVLDDDIWICSFARSGTTWMSEMVWTIANDCDFEKAKLSMFDRIRFIDMGFLFDANKSPEKNQFDAIVDPINYGKNQPRPRVIKTHLPFHLLPKQIQTGQKKPRIFYICRNPLDVSVSYYYHLASMVMESQSEFKLNLEQFCDSFLEGKILYGPFWEHIFPFWKIKDQPNVLFLTYEEMKADLPGVIRKAAKFLNKTPSEEQMKNLEKHLSFESMQKNVSVNKSDIMEFIKKGGAIYSPFVRSGKVGGYKKEMSESQIKKFQKWIDANLSGTGLRF